MSSTVPLFFFFNDTATTEIYTLSLHDALPIFGYDDKSRPDLSNTQFFVDAMLAAGVPKNDPAIQNALKFINRCQNLRSEEHTSELHSHLNLVCRLLL